MGAMAILRQISCYCIRTGRPESIFDRLTSGISNSVAARSMSRWDKSPAINTSRYTSCWFCSRIRKYKQEAFGTYADENFDLYDSSE